MAHLDQHATEEIKTVLDNTPQDQPLVAPEETNRAMKTIMLAIREVLQDPKATVRTIRRGALIAMALAGTPTETLMQLSGHTQVRTLRKYLGHGAHEAATHYLTTEATRTLWA